MQDKNQHFNDIANTLMDELSLVSDKEQNREVFKVERDMNAEPGEIVLNEDELDFINYCVPDEFLKENGLNVNCYRDHLAIVQKENPEAIKVLISKLFNSGHTPEYVNVAEEEQEYYQPIEVLLHDYPDFQKAIECNPHRVTVMGFAELKSEEAHIYSFPLPPAISKGRKKRRMTVTLAWMSPIASENQKYRKARMWVKLNDNDNLFKRIGSKIDVADTMAAQRGTLQHEVFEGESHFPFEDGTMLEFKVNCADDAGGFKEPIKYALAVTLEVTEPITPALFPELEESNIYQEVKDRLKIKEAVSIRQNM